MALKTYGSLHYNATNRQFVITKAEPHVSIKLKSTFPRIPRTAVPPYNFPDTPQNAADLAWFMQRYALQMTDDVQARVTGGNDAYYERLNRLEQLLAPDYKAPVVALAHGQTPRPYQVQASQLHLSVKRLLLMDDLGLGKTLSSILSMLEPATLPAVVVVETHLPTQWKNQIERFTNLRVHLINGTRPYSLPEADVYVMKYSCLAGWTNFFETRFFRYAIFDEVQALRNTNTERYFGGVALSQNVEYTLGLSATPIYNYGDEMFSVMNLLNPDCLGPREAFLREWAHPGPGAHYTIDDPQALGTYLRESHLVLRRTRADVGRVLKPVNTIVQTVGYDSAEVKKVEDLARTLAMRITSGSFEERGQAARELDMLARMTTGVSKAREVAGYVRMLLESGEPVVLAGWHRDVYAIWLKELAEFKPVMYTGSESGAHKEKAKKAFISGETNLFIISLRSSAGLDGLQHRCRTVVIGELDWSPKVHEQLIARIDRDGQLDQVMAIYCVSEEGSDPVIINLLGLKSSQSHGIVNPLEDAAPQYSDESRIKALAAYYLREK